MFFNNYIAEPNSAPSVAGDLILYILLGVDNTFYFDMMQYLL